MNHKERIMAVLKKQAVDHIPWVPRLDMWYLAHKEKNTLPLECQDSSLWDIHRNLELAMYERNGQVYREKIQNLELVIHYRDRRIKDEMLGRYKSTIFGRFKEVEEVEIKYVQDAELGPYEIVVEYITPLGAVCTRFSHPPELQQAGVRPVQREYMIKQKKHYRIVEYIIENTEVIPTYSRFLQIQRKIGDDGVVFAMARYCPMHEILRSYLGYERGCYELYDHPREVRHLWEVLTEQKNKIQDICVNSPAELVSCGANFDSAIISPSLFGEYFLPYFRRFSQLLHEQAKILISHTDGEMKGLLEVFLETGIDVAEAFTPCPMTKLTLTEVRKLWQDRIIIWGGIPSIVLSQDFPRRKFKDYIINIFREIAPGKAFILGVGDNTPADAPLERITEINQMVKKYGQVLL